MFKLFPWMCLTVLLAALIGSWSFDGIVAELMQPQLTAAERITRLQNFFDGAGSLAPLIYVGFVTAEVIIALIPGVMLYAPGGLIFGPWFGGLLALAGNVIGAGIACQLVRTLGSRWCAKLLDEASMEKLLGMLDRRGPLLIVLLRLNPVTSSDLVSYAAGCTRIPVLRAMLATGVGMAPLCFAQSWLSESVFQQWPQLIWPLLIGTMIYLVSVVMIVARLLRRPVAVPVET